MPSAWTKGAAAAGLLFSVLWIAAALVGGGTPTKAAITTGMGLAAGAAFLWWLVGIAGETQRREDDTGLSALGYAAGVATAVFLLLAGPLATPGPALLAVAAVSTFAFGFVILRTAPLPQAVGLVGLLAALVMVAGLATVFQPSWSAWLDPVKPYPLPAWVLVASLAMSMGD